MAGSTFGNQFKITTWGESHGKAVGVVIDGCPAGLALTESDIQYYLNLRKPGQSRYTTPRKEEDAVEIMSGIFEGRTTGTPTTKMHVLPTIRILPDTIVPDMQTTPLMPSTVSEITAAADVHRPVRPSAVSQPVLLP